MQVVQDLADRGLRVIIPGLDTDWQGKPFEPMPTLMAIAESVTKQHAVCVVCGSPASRTQRTAGETVKFLSALMMPMKRAAVSTSNRKSISPRLIFQSSAKQIWSN